MTKMEIMEELEKLALETRGLAFTWPGLNSDPRDLKLIIILTKQITLMWQLIHKLLGEINKT